MAADIIRLTPSDAERYGTLRRKMLVDSPWAFSSIPEDDFAQDVDNLRRLLAQPQYEILAAAGASDDSVLVAAAGIYRMSSPKFAHRAKLWGVFVDASFRGRGLGRAVVAAAITTAGNWIGVDFIDLSVSVNAPEARSLYQRLGFLPWGREPESTQIDGQRYDEIFMTLRIERTADA